MLRCTGETMIVLIITNSGVTGGYGTGQVQILNKCLCLVEQIITIYLQILCYTVQLNFNSIIQQFTVVCRHLPIQSRNIANIFLFPYHLSRNNSVKIFIKIYNNEQQHIICILYISLLFNVTIKLMFCTFRI